VSKADNLPSSCAVVTKSGKVNFLEPSGPVQPCNGTALHLLFITFLLCLTDTSLYNYTNLNKQTNHDGASYDQE